MSHADSLCPRCQSELPSPRPSVCPKCGSNLQPTAEVHPTQTRYARGGESGNVEVDRLEATHDYVPVEPSLDETKQETRNVSEETATPDGSGVGSAASVNVPGYSITEELGRGGMGVVYRGVHLELERPVALKMILAGAYADEDQLERFRTEAQAVARFKHPNIVQIYDIGNHDGNPFCALEFVGGGNLASAVESKTFEPIEAARLVELLARAMHYAHQQNVIHRDLKPANVLLDENGQPKITDFGLAKKLDDDSGRTQSGAIMGTPSYMAPEQADGRLEDIAPATDVYALGGILYALLTGRPPFRGKNQFETLQAVLRDEPVSLRTHRSDVPIELETICLKCLAKNPDKRYRSALMLAQDLERWQAGEPILARPEGLLAKTARKLKRHRVGLSVVAVVLALLSVAGYFAYNLSTSEDVNTQRTEIEQLLEREIRDVSRLEMIEGKIDTLARTEPKLAEDYRRRALKNYEQFISSLLKAERFGEAQAEEVRKHQRAVASRDAAKGRELALALLERLAGWRTAIDLKPPFSDLPTVFARGTVEAKAGQLVATAESQALGPTVRSKVRCRGHLEITVDFDESWSRAKTFGVTLNTTEGHRAGAGTLAFSPSGSILASGSPDGTVRFWDLSTNDEPRVVALGERVLDAAFTPDGRFLVVGSSSQLSWIDSASSAIEKQVPTEQGELHAVAVSRDGKAIATAGSTGTIKLWDNDAKETATWPAHDGVVVQLAWMPNQQTLVSGGRDGTVRFWDRATRKAQTFVANHEQRVESFAISPDGQTLAVSHTKGMTLWDLTTRKVEKTLRESGTLGNHNYLEFSVEGDLATGVGLYKKGTEKPRFLWGQLFDNDIQAVAFSATGTRFACSSKSGAIYLFDPNRGRLLTTLGQRGYTVQLVDADPEEAPPSPVKNRRLEILRDGMTLVSKIVRLREGVLQLRVVRDGYNLRANVREFSTEFFDPLPLPANSGVFGLLLPRSVGVRSIAAKQKERASNPSPLEEGDALYSSARYQEALASYSAQLDQTKKAEVSQEARYKIGWCQLLLNREAEAVASWQGLMAEEGKRWPTLASCQLWLHFLETNQLGAANTVFETISTRFELSDLVDTFPVEKHRVIFEKYKVKAGINFLFARPEDVARMEQAYEVSQFLKLPDHLQSFLLKDLVRLLTVTDQPEKALELAAESVRIGDRMMKENRLWNIELPLMEYCWLLRTQGRPDEALAVLDGHLYTSPGVYADPPRKGNLHHYLFERINIFAAKGEWDKVQDTLDECFRLAEEEPKRVSHNFLAYSTMHLLQGFVHDRAGDEAKAMQMWTLATKKTWKEKYHADVQGPLPFSPNPTVSMLTELIAGSISGTLTPAEAKPFIEKVRATVAGQGAGFDALIQKVPGIDSAIQKMWQSQRGRELARRIVFREASFRETVLDPPKLLGHEYIRQKAFNSQMSPAQDAVVWTLATRGMEKVISQEIPRSQLGPLGLTWLGSSGFFGWGLVKNRLDPEFRAYAAYVFGNRYMNSLAKPMDAIMFFETTEKDAPEGSPLKGLAKMELDKLKKPKD